MGTPPQVLSSSESGKQEVEAQVDVAVHGLLSRGRREEKEKDKLQITPWVFL